MSDEVSVHPSAVCEADAVGPGSHVEAFASVAAGCVLGERCAIRAGAQVLSGAQIDSDVVVGANAVVGDNVRIERGAVVEPGSVVADDVPANAMVRGNPARIVGYVGDEVDHPPARSIDLSSAHGRRRTQMGGVEILRLTRADDLRGSLMAAEFSELPFVPARLFTVSGVPSEHIRGSHAHRKCEQLLVCISGTVSCVVDNGELREEFRLDGPDFGLYTPPMTWATQYKYSADATLLVLASLPYDPADYIRDYDEFRRLVGQEAPEGPSQ